MVFARDAKWCAKNRKLMLISERVPARSLAIVADGVLKAMRNTFVAAYVMYDKASARVQGDISLWRPHKYGYVKCFVMRNDNLLTRFRMEGAMRMRKSIASKHPAVMA
ncbi:uncharacterized protein N7511_004272 [Penicillium nucicola]|uniref:uncharacterized protein n=1 Tax=Penicillium nucicola TaxID=1850975 RepID=UPI0025456898|nr:uncharacterized protein N7511_004272 [Penicillium nucicola]KAJ5766656.1 hypothetical protein N7511_004272 [Penicillium nucicola]